MTGTEIREKTDAELEHLLLERTDELMHIRIQDATGVVDNVRATRGAKKDIARIKTIQNERKRAQAGTTAGEKS